MRIFILRTFFDDVIIEKTHNNRILMTGPAEEIFEGTVTQETLYKWLS